MFGVAIQGAGDVSTEHIKAYESHPATRVVAIGSRTKQGAQKKADELGVACAIYDDFEEMMAHPDVDIVSICTPPDRHAEETIKAAEAGKHVLIEKPVAVNNDELGRMDEAVRRAGVKSVIGFVLRWNPLLLTIKAAIERGWIGRPHLVQADYWHGGSNTKPKHFNHRLEVGALVHGGSHAMDAARYVLNDDKVVQVSGVSPDADDHSEYRWTTVATVKFAGGAVGKVSGSTRFFMPYVFNIEVFGDEGAIRNNQFYTKAMPGQRSFAEIPTILPDSGAVSHHPFPELIDHFVDCILTDTESHNNLANAVNTHSACFAAEASAAHGSKVIRLDD